jgi:hypothetical protein
MVSEFILRVVYIRKYLLCRLDNKLRENSIVPTLPFLKCNNGLVCSIEQAV